MTACTFKAEAYVDAWVRFSIEGLYLRVELRQRDSWEELACVRLQHEGEAERLAMAILTARAFAEVAQHDR